MDSGHVSKFKRFGIQTNITDRALGEVFALMDFSVEHAKVAETFTFSTEIEGLRQTHDLLARAIAVVKRCCDAVLAFDTNAGKSGVSLPDLRDLSGVIRQLFIARREECAPTLEELTGHYFQTAYNVAETYQEGRLQTALREAAKTVRDGAHDLLNRYSRFPDFPGLLLDAADKDADHDDDLMGLCRSVREDVLIFQSVQDAKDMAGTFKKHWQQVFGMGEDRELDTLLEKILYDDRVNLRALEDEFNAFIRERTATYSRETIQELVQTAQKLIDIRFRMTLGGFGSGDTGVDLRQGLIDVLDRLGRSGYGRGALGREVGPDGEFRLQQNPWDLRDDELYGTDARSSGLYDGEGDFFRDPPRSRSRRSPRSGSGRSASQRPPAEGRPSDSDAPLENPFAGDGELFLPDDF